MKQNFVSMGMTGRGHWVSVLEDDVRHLLGPYPSRNEANRIAKNESDRVGLTGAYRGVPTHR